jgi:hypothetical protein
MRGWLGDWFRKDNAILECSKLILVPGSWLLLVFGLCLEDLYFIFIDTKLTHLDWCTIRTLKFEPYGLGCGVKCYVVLAICLVFRTFLCNCMNSCCFR